MKTKRCSSCKQDVPATSEYFSKNKDGFSNYCRICANERVKLYRKTHQEKMAKYREDTKEQRSKINKQYYEENKEKIDARNNQYNKSHSERLSAYKKEWKIINKDKVAETDRLYNELNKDILLEKGRRYYKVNKGQFAIQHRKYYENNIELVAGFHRTYRINNPELLKISSQRRRAKKYLLPSTLTIDQWENIKQYFESKCCYCGQEKPLEQEHFIALSKGGEYTHNNIIPACRSCNAQKRDKDFFEWYPKHKYYSKKREKYILEFLNYKGNIQQLALTF